MLKEAWIRTQLKQIEVVCTNIYLYKLKQKKMEKKRKKKLK